MTAASRNLGTQRRAVLAAAAAAAVTTLFAGRRANADEVTVPVGLQVELLSKVVSYDRNFVARVRDRVQVLTVTRRADPSSTRIAQHIGAAFERVQRLGTFPFDHSVLAFEDAANLNRQCRQRSVDIVYITLGLDDAMPQIVEALTGLDLLSVSANPAHVPARAVLGFDLVSGRPKVLVHLGQARLQNVAFRSDLLKLARVYS